MVLYAGDEAERERCRVAADLYYNGDFTQDDVASYLGISRPWVSRLLKRARALKVVTIHVEPPSRRPVPLENALAHALGVERCLVASSGIDETARLAASHLAAILRDNDILGLAWGRTLAKTVEAFEPLVAGPRGIRCVALIGGTSVVRPEIDADRLVPMLAAKVGALPHVLNAPAFVENGRVRSLLMNEPGIRATLALAERATVTLMCIGGLGSSTIHELGTLSDREFSGLRDRAAVGDVCQWFIDASGALVHPSPAQRMISADLAKIKTTARERIAIVAGEDRVPAILAAARGGWFSTLVTDLSTARALLSAVGVRPGTVENRAVAASAATATPPPRPSPVRSPT